MDNVTRVRCSECGEIVDYDTQQVQISQYGYSARWICPVCGNQEDFYKITLSVDEIPDKVFIRYEHHGVPMKVREDLKGKHKDYCLCYSCEHFNPTDRHKNCPIANNLFAFNKTYGVVTPVWECVQFKEKK
jgi:hypothetical protein